MDELRIITDSCCDLTPELERELNAERSIPFFLNVGSETFVDDETLVMSDFMAKMKACTGKMGSACPSPEKWKDAFIRAGGGFAVTISSKLSAMYQTAKLGLEMAKDEVSGLIGHVFDSKSAVCGEVLTAMKVRQFSRSESRFEDVVHKVENFIEEMKTFILLEDVSNLVKNGRMSRIKGTIVQVLGIKPVLQNKDGEIDTYARLRGSSNIAGKFLESIAQYKRKTKGQDLVISHCNNPTLAEEVRAKAQEMFDFGRILVLETYGLSSLYSCDKGVVLSY